ncbi:stage IV sporulation protein A [Sedimentibacter sp. zth1]|uniref:stage IV sporulation protein A n=1 Tax=Sedimentibacter sp. zth1 TaxID=2816908 RepID=UPI001F5ECC59
MGVVGPVRTGKSTFIRKFSEIMMIPNIEDEYVRERARDEMPQSGTGKTITTTEPKFVPSSAVRVALNDNVNTYLRLIDCVGYMIPGALGHIENEQPRFVSTPWSDQQIPFTEAAEIGTKKVINEHSTIGILVTTDGSITEINRDNYIMAEERVVKELKEIDKPFVIILNSTNPHNENTVELAKQLKEKYNAPVQVIDCLNLQTSDVDNLINKVLYEFPIREINIDLPRWFDGLSIEHPLKNSFINSLKDDLENCYKISDFDADSIFSSGNDFIQEYFVKDIELGDGSINVKIDVDNAQYYKVISDITGCEIEGEHQILKLIEELSKSKKEYERVADALNEARTKGYGYVTPNIDDMIIEKPQLFKEGGRYGIKIKANAPSLHIINANLSSEISPIIGSKNQSEDFINYICDSSSDNPNNIWKAEIFGKTLYDLVEEQLEGKLTAMPENARRKIKRTIEKIVNDGSGSIIFIII